MAQDYWHEDYWHANYWHANYWAEFVAAVVAELNAALIYFVRKRREERRLPGARGD
jgi:hypothetical protein